MGRVALRASLEAGRLAFALAVALCLRTGAREHMPAPDDGERQPRVRGAELLFGGFVGLVGAIVVTVIAQWVWGRHRRRAG